MVCSIFQSNSLRAQNVVNTQFISAPMFLLSLCVSEVSCQKSCCLVDLQLEHHNIYTHHSNMQLIHLRCFLKTAVLLQFIHIKLQLQLAYCYILHLPYVYILLPHTQSWRNIAAVLQQQRNNWGFFYIYKESNMFQSMLWAWNKTQQWKCRLQTLQPTLVSI